jgi:hypothetical protein
MSADALAVADVNTHEKTVAGGLNVAAIFFPYIGPVIGLAISAGSKFVKFNAYRCLIEQVTRTILVGLIIVASLSYSIYSMVQAGVFKDGIDLSKIDWVTLLIKSAVTWLAFAAWALWNTVSLIRYALQGFAGKLPAKMRWVDRLAAKWAGLSAR